MSDVLPRNLREFWRRGAAAVVRRLPDSPRVLAAIERLWRGQAGNGEQIEVLRRELRTCNESIRLLTRLLADTAARAGPAVVAGPMISVIMPVYNRAGIAAAAIASVLAQEGAAFELIVIDDGSTDGFGPAVVPALAAPGVRLLRVARGGAPAARNAGLAAAAGRVIAYLDSDNTMYPGYLRALSDAYAKAEVGSAYAALLWDDGAQMVQLRQDDFAWADLLAQRINIDLNCFSHRAAVAALCGGFDETLTKHADFDLVLRYTRDAAPLRLGAVAARYYNGNGFARLSHDAASAPNFARIVAKHRPVARAGLKVLIYCSDYPQLSESYVDTEIAFMVAQGCEVEVFQRVSPGAPGVALVPVHVADLAGVIAAFRPDVVHCHWLPMAAEVAALAAARGIPVTVRGHGFEFSEESLANCAMLGAVKSIYLFPHFVAAAGEDGGGKIRAVTSCFSKQRFYPRVGQDRRLVLRAAACLDSKDIEAFIRVASCCPQHRFVLALARIADLPDLPGRFAALNAALGGKVEIRMDVGNEEMAALTREAGIYLHTFGFKQPFGMPVSIAEALACGAVVLVRDCAAARRYAGGQAFYYDTEDEAAAYINATLGWAEAEWVERARANADFAYEIYADDKVLGAILRDWQRLCGVADERLGEDAGDESGSLDRKNRGCRPSPA